MNFCALKRQIQLKRCLHLTKRNNGYIVLVPEIGEEDSSANLQSADGLPKFNSFTIENCLAAIGRQAKELENSVKEIETSAATDENFQFFDELTTKLEPLTSRLETTWGVAKALYLGNSTLMPTKSFIHIHERAKNARAAKYTNQVIYDRISRKDFKIEGETPEKRRLLDKFVLEGRLNGLGLDTDKKLQLREVLDKLNHEKSLFERKVRTSVEKFSHTITNYSIVRDFPPQLLKDLAVDQSQPTKGPWRVYLRPKSIQGFFEFCPSGTERWNVWQADVRKCSSTSEKSLDNSTTIEEIRTLRQIQAQLLGYPDYAAMSMETKMVGSVENARNIFASLSEYAKPAQEAELKQLRDFANECGFGDKIEIFDIPYWKRKLAKSAHEFDEEMVREYFPLSRVLSGLFDLCEEVFGINIVERNTVEGWHPDVKFFDIFEKSSPSESICGLYLDCFSRDTRLSLSDTEGWMVGIQSRCAATNTKPLCALIFNFLKPMYGKPYLLSLNDLRTLFGNFGAAIQHLLTKANYTDLAGLSNIEWDASQISPQVMINFLDDPDVLKEISGHYSTEEQLSDTQVKGISIFKKLTAGYDLSRELYLSDLDLHFHTSKDFWLDIMKELWPKYNCLPLDKKDSHPCSFTKIFSGDWGAAYFSRTYSKMIAADISKAFIEDKLKNSNYANVSQRFRDTFIASGGSMRSSEVFRRFRGRDPSPHALLTSLDIKVSQANET